MKVFVVLHSPLCHCDSDGSYNCNCYEGRFAAVFSSKEKAERWMEKNKYAKYEEIEEVELNPHNDCIEYLEKGYYPFSIHLDKEGNIIEINDKYYILDDINIPFIFYHEKKDKREEFMRVNVMGKTKEHAVQIAQNIRIDIIALNLWQYKGNIAYCLEKIDYKHPLEELNV